MVHAIVQPLWCVVHGTDTHALTVAYARYYAGSSGLQCMSHHYASTKELLAATDSH